MLLWNYRMLWHFKGDDRWLSHQCKPRFILKYFKYKKVFFQPSLKNSSAWSLPQAQISDLITSRETEKPQWAFCLWLVSPVFSLQTLQATKWSTFSPTFCSCASGGAWFAMGPSKGPEGQVTRAAAGVTTIHFPRHGILLMQIRGIRASPVPPPPAPPATARISHKLSLYKAFCVRKRHPTTTAPLCSIFYISKVRCVQNPHLCRRAGSAPTACPLFENDGLLLPTHSA